MPKDYIYPIKDFTKTLTRYIGEEKATFIMTGSEKVVDFSLRDFSLWFKTVIERLDETVNEKTKIQIMEENGRQCFEMNKMNDPYKSDFEKIKQYDNIGDFIRDSQYYGESLFMDKNVVTQKYKPPKLGHGINCFCSLWWGLKEEETVSCTWCHCGKGLIAEYWKKLVEKFNLNINVTMLGTCIQGAKECTFEIHLE